MVAASVTPQNIVPAGLEQVLAAVASVDGIYFAVDSGERNFVEVLNGGGGDITATVAAVQTTTRVPGVGTVAVPNIAVVVTAGERRMIGPFSGAYRRSDGTVLMTFSGVTSVTAAAYKLPALS